MMLVVPDWTESNVSWKCHVLEVRDTYTVAMVVLRRHRGVLLAKQLELPLQHLDLYPMALSQLLDVASGVMHAYGTESVRRTLNEWGLLGSQYHDQTARSQNMAAMVFVSIFQTQLVKWVVLTASPRVSSRQSAATGIRGSARRGWYSPSLILTTGWKEGTRWTIEWTGRKQREKQGRTKN